jgi:hypothetical protein
MHRYAAFKRSDRRNLALIASRVFFHGRMSKIISAVDPSTGNSPAIHRFSTARPVTGFVATRQVV